MQNYLFEERAGRYNELNFISVYKKLLLVRNRKQTLVFLERNNT